MPMLSGNRLSHQPACGIVYWITWRRTNMPKRKVISCPYCDHVFGKLPPDRTGCPNCGEILYVYDSILSNRKILLTEEGLFTMVKVKASQESSDYFTARLQELDASFRKASASTSHYGELGRELETLVKALLSEYLPNKYKVGTGFVRSLEKPGWQSNQIDILLSRNDICYPIAVHQQYSVFPLESIISFMEVTSNLTKAKLNEDYEKVAELQRLHKRLYYIPDPPAGVKQFRAFDLAVHPRFYYFAFATNCSEDSILHAMLDLSNEYRIQLHVLFVLKPGFCLMMPNPTRDRPYQNIIKKEKPRDAIISFLQHILRPGVGPR